MVKDIVTFSELLDKLMVINIKLFNLLEKTSELDKKEPKSKDDVDLIVNLSGENIRLVKQRSILKSAIDEKLNTAIKNDSTDVLDEVKNYSR